MDLSPTTLATSRGSYGETVLVQFVLKDAVVHKSMLLLLLMMMMMTMLLQLDGEQVTLNVDDWSARNLLDVIRRNLLPPIVEFSRDASRLIALSNVVNHVLLFTSRRHDNHASAVDAFTQAAALFQQQVRARPFMT